MCCVTWRQKAILCWLPSPMPHENRHERTTQTLQPSWREVSSREKREADFLRLRPKQMPNKNAPYRGLFQTPLDEYLAITGVLTFWKRICYRNGPFLCPRSFISDISHFLQVLRSGEGCADRRHRCAIYNHTGKYRHKVSFCVCLLPVCLHLEWCAHFLLVFLIIIISFREMSGSSVSRLFPCSYQPSVVWPETESTAAASLMIHTAGRLSWTPLSVKLTFVNIELFLCFVYDWIGCVSCMVNMVVSFQSDCRACDYREVLYALLGLIINLSAVTSPAIQVI